MCEGLAKRMILLLACYVVLERWELRRAGGFSEAESGYARSALAFDSTPGGTEKVPRQQIRHQQHYIASEGFENGVIEEAMSFEIPLSI